MTKNMSFAWVLSLEYFMQTTCFMLGNCDLSRFLFNSKNKESIST